MTCLRLFKPNARFRRVEEITPLFLLSHGIRGVLLDVDNTLSPHNAPEPNPQAMQWLAQMRESGIEVVIVSNNHEPRVAPFAAKLGLRHISEASKPLPSGFLRAQQLLNLPRESLAVVGDQLFTDMAGGNTARMFTVLVDPILPESSFFFRVKRTLERPFLANYRYTEAD